VRVTPPTDRRRRVGALLLAGVALLALGLWKRPDPFARHTIVRAVVSDASGLARIGADVRVAGTPVGKVDGVRPAHGGAELTLRLDRSVGTVHRDATAALRPRLMFEGTAYVELTLGSPSAPALGDRPIRRTSTYVPIADALRILDARGRTNLRATAAGLAGALSGGTAGDANALLRDAPALVRDTGAVAVAARGPHGTELAAAVEGLSATAGAVATRADDLLPAADAARRTADAVTSARGAAFDTALARLPATAARVRTGGAAAASTLARLDPLVRDLAPAAQRLGPALAATRPLLRAAAPALNRAAPVLADAAALLRAAPAASIPTRRALAALTPTLDRLNGGLLDALERKTTLGTPAYLSFLGLFAGGGGASRPFGAQGDGHFMRFGLRFLTGAGQPLPPCTLLDKANAALGAAVAQGGGCTP
jgi:ABC-type transporter Mla subunit MlaD